MIKPNLQVPGLEIGEEIGRGGHSILYRATRDGKPYVVKVLKDDGSQPDTEEAHRRFQREGTALARFHHPGLVAIQEVGQEGNTSGGRPYLVMEYVEGVTLASLLTKERPPEGKIVTWAMGLASALSEVHRLGLVHRDIKPENILIDKTGLPKLIDFGFVAVIQPHSDTDEVVGSFRYSSPEQTGMLKRVVDGRSDLYSLGVVLFECATGSPPFSSDNVGDLIRQHAVVKAPDVRTLSPTISPVLAMIVTKLLAKDPDDRYQTAYGLLKDLESLDPSNQALKANQTVELDRAEIPTTGVSQIEHEGREEELQRLRNVWARVVAKNPTVLLVKGEAGSGKTRLLEEFIKEIPDNDAIILRGQCSQKNPVPFASLRAAVDEWLGQVQRLPPPEKKRLEEIIREAAGDWGHLLHHLSPGMQALLHTGVSLPITESSQEQFHTAVADFLVKLSRHRATLLFVDDVQWIDGATLRVLKQVRRNLSGLPFFLAAVCRIEGAAEHPELDYFLEQMNIPEDSVVSLGPLGEVAVTRIIKQFLGGYNIDNSFARQIAFRCKGNPFAICEYIRAMLDEGYLRFSWGNWTLATDELGLIQLPGDVIQLIVKRIQGLSTGTVHILCAAAVQGMKVDTRVLVKISGGTPSEVQSALGEAFQAGLVERISYERYLFVHERIRDAFIGVLDSEELKRLHQRTAEVEDHASVNGEDSLYALADHYARGQVAKSPLRVYEICLQAGKKAAGHYANQEAFNFLVNAYKASLHYTSTPEPGLFQALGDLCFRLDHVDTGISFLKRALELTTKPIERAELRVQQANGQLARLDIAKAREAMLMGFTELGSPYPKTRLIRVCSAFFWWAIGNFTRLPLFFGKAKGEERERCGVLVKLYMVGGVIAFHDFDEALTIEFMCRVHHPALRLGLSRELSGAYSHYAILMTLAGFRKRGRKYLAASSEIAEKIRDPGAVAESNLFYGYSREFSGDASQAFLLLRDCLKHYGRWLNHHNYVEACFTIIIGLQSRGYVSEAWGWLQEVHRKVQDHLVPDRMGLLHQYAYQAAALARMGRMTQSVEAMSEAKTMVASLPDDRFSWVFYLMQLLIYHTELGELGAEIDEVERLYSEKVRTSPKTRLVYIRYYYLFRAHARLMLCLREDGEKLLAARLKLRSALEDFKPARRMPTFRGHYLVIRAGLALVEGRKKQALKLIRFAEDAARDLDQPWVCFETAYLRARILKLEGKTEPSLREASAAHAVARETGWNGFARRIRTEFPFDRPAEYSIVATRSSYTHSDTSDATGGKLKRQLDALLQVSLASASVLDPVALTRIALDEIIRILGAERGFLFLCKEGNGQANDDLVIQGGRDQAGKDLQELSGFSSTVVKQVQVERTPLVITGTDAGKVLESASIVAHGLRSIVAVPLMLKDRFMGVVYLDNRLAKGVFTDEDVEVLVAISSHIAVAFETSRVALLEMERGKIKSAFQHYLSHEVIDQLLNDPKQLALRSERRELTVLFSDVRNFTGISESLSPEQLSELMNAYFTPMTNLILDSQGVLDKYIGDAVMAFWGAPVLLDNHADRAAEVAIKMLSELELLQGRLLQKGFPTIEIGVGLNTGIMSVGNMGSTQRFNYTVLGDSVNLGSRLEGLTKVYGVKIIVSEFTRQKLTPSKFVCRELDEVRVRGKSTPLRIYELMIPDAEKAETPSPTFLEEFAEGRRWYLEQNWSRAKEHFTACLKLRPGDFPSKLYLSRLQQYATQPPEKNWDGVAISMRR